MRGLAAPAILVAATLVGNALVLSVVSTRLELTRKALREMEAEQAGLRDVLRAQGAYAIYGRRDLQAQINACCPTEDK